jgi:hypothetical protein
MTLGLEPEPLRTESRFHPDTVKKAVALAQQLEHRRRETLSLEQVTQLADELNLDPQLLQQALAQISAQEARQAQLQVPTQTAAQLRQTRMSWILLIIGLLLAIPLLLLGWMTTSVAPPTVAAPQRIEAPMAAPAPSAPVAPTAPLPGGR